MNTEYESALLNFINQGIICNQSSLIDHLFNNGIFDYSDVENIYDEKTEEYQEVFEWWVVSEWMAEKLKEKGEVILDNDYGLWWGRCTTGQSIVLDYVIQKIHSEINRF